MKRQTWLLILLLLAALSYEPINRSIHGGRSLSGSLDSHIPLVPLFAIPYILFLPILLTIVINSYIKRLDFIRLALVLVFVYLISDLLFLIFQTYVPRPETTNGLLRFVYNHDRPYCDFPSEHVASAVILMLYAWRFASWRWLVLGFGTLVISSTLFIKQHSILGVVAGIILGASTWFFLTKLINRFKLAT